MPDAKINLELLNNWTALNAAIMQLNEAQVQNLINLEKSERARIRVLLRLYNRFSKLRSQREKRELANASKA